MVALLEREKSGEGQHVQTSLLEAQIFTLDFQAARFLIDNVVPKQAGNNHPTSIPTGVYKTKDGQIEYRDHRPADLGAVLRGDRSAASVGSSRLFFGGRALEEPRRAQCRDREDPVDSATARNGSSGSTAWAWRPDRSMPSTKCSPIRRCSILGSRPHENADRGALKVMRQPVSLSRTPSAVVAPTPERGEHTQAVLAEFGFNDNDIAALRKAKVI